MSLPNGWKKVKLGDFAQIFDGTHQTPEYVDKGIPFVSVENISDIWGTDKYITQEAFNAYSTKPQKGDILMTRITAGVIGKTAIIDSNEPLAYYVSLALIRCRKEDVIPVYLSQFIEGLYFKSELNKRIIHTAFPKKINLNDIGKCEVILPPLEEQKKIAETLSVWDNAIEKTEKLIEAKSNHFNQMIDNLIVKKSLNSSWETFAIKEIFDVVNRKNKSGNTNVLTSSAQYGLVNQQEYYKKDIASSDISGYYLLQKGDFAYNRSYSTGYPYGVVKRLDKYESGVLSTLYLCMSLKEPYQSFSDYLVFLFESSYLNNQLALICREGARNHGLLNVSKEDFFNLKIQLPSEKEQAKIVSVLQLYSKELNLLKQQLENYKKQKQGLMQKLLTGQWRVK